MPSLCRHLRIISVAILCRKQDTCKCTQSHQPTVVTGCAQEHHELEKHRHQLLDAVAACSRKIAQLEAESYTALDELPGGTAQPGCELCTCSPLAGAWLAFVSRCKLSSTVLK